MDNGKGIKYSSTRDEWGMKRGRVAEIRTYTAENP